MWRGEIARHGVRILSIGLIGLIDDVVGLAKLAAASLDDATAQAARAGVKAAGVVVDDTAVAPRFVMGFAASRELPIVGKIALGSLRNKLLILMPGALALSLFAPWAITPILMLGGAYLCYEGTEKVLEMVAGHPDNAEDGPTLRRPEDVLRQEQKRVAAAVRTDLILSAEIMAITLSSVAQSPFWTRAFVLVAVGIFITALVYGAVVIIVKADDVGLALSRTGRPVLAPFGRFIVRAMPGLLRGLSLVGTAAMLWVGGGIVLHGLEHFGWTAPSDLIHGVAQSVQAALGAAGTAAAWVVSAAAAGLGGLLLGVLIAPLANRLALAAAH
jgi:predicted DNA repair protein MutK